MFFVYGFNTPSGLFANRTGTASYAGVAYGAGANANGTVYDVSGAAKMSVDYGAFGFAGNLSSYGSSATADIRRDAGSPVGSMLVNFYGPSADEAAGVFRLRVPDGVGANTLINGAMVVKGQ